MRGQDVEVFGVVGFAEGVHGVDDFGFREEAQCVDCLGGGRGDVREMVSFVGPRPCCGVVMAPLGELSTSLTGCCVNMADDP